MRAWLTRLVTLVIVATVATGAVGGARRARAAPVSDHATDDDAPWDEAPAEGDPPRPVIGPRIGLVVAAAYRASGLDHDAGRGLAWRARLGGLVPWLSVRTARDTSWHDGDPDIGRGTTLEVRATWRLDRLVFDSRELGASSLERARRRDRRRLASRVIRAYFTWRRASALVSERARDRADEAAAELDAVTEGWFSEAVADARRAASGGRTPCPPQPRGAAAPAATP